MRRRRKTLYMLLAVIVVLVALEAAARLVERVRSRARSASPSATPADQNRIAGENADAVPLLAFQQIFDRYLATVDIRGRGYMRPDNVDRGGQLFERIKPPGQQRVVILGGSQAGAMGLSDGASYARYLERFLRARHPDRDIRVINLARTGYSSQHHVLIAKKTFAEIKPDLVLAVIGNNERLDIKAYTQQKRAPADAVALNRALRRNSALVRLLTPRRAAPEAVGEGGRPLPLLVNDPAWEAFWVARLERSVRSLADECRAVGAKLVLCQEPSNLEFVDVREWWWAENYESDPRLIESRHWLMYGKPRRALELLESWAKDRPGPKAELLLGKAWRAVGDRAKAEEHYRETIRLLETTPHIQPEVYMFLNLQARAALGEAERVRTMALDYRGSEIGQTGRLGVIGLVLLAAGLNKEAHDVFVQARDQDNLAIRSTGTNTKVLHLLSDQLHLSFRDLDEEFSNTCADRICGWDTYLDYCHFNPMGHVRLAGLLLGLVEKELGLPSVAGNPAPETERSLYAALRGRERDFPELSRWLGVDDTITALSNEHIVPGASKYRSDPRDPTSLCFEADFLIDSMASPEDLLRAVSIYERALKLDGHFAAAQANLDLLRARFGDAVSP
jgi:tetratricopeptide (TPR) repeat protein